MKAPGLEERSPKALLILNAHEEIGRLLIQHQWSIDLLPLATPLY